ncbi:hypothetical protein YOLOSWAG_83 [Erwinia phage vB_EamM_Yoloswag]|uniref:Uncharacterized protein n=1 Tax=Erwinia phage vB_EamM_Yoloswag TaxID=1958956 RepID=A0A1S6L318_9CAUD|nr:hypothetical protein HOR66_gp083 [Erwinia phage vB_EamM_Yoloswag]AQT28566.1 hypothetical protein YOLOSWAG_83 [Erwinia phage vB_EamM_Yoloswag]
MQLILPKGDQDLKKYSYFFDASTNTEFTTISQLVQILRNTRSTPLKLEGDTVVMSEMLGIADNPIGNSGVQNLYLTRIGFVGVLPDFSSDREFLRTFVPTVLGTGDRTNNQNNVDAPISDETSDTQMFGLRKSDFVYSQGITCLWPTKVGTVVTSGLRGYAAPAMSSAVNKTFGGQSGGSVQHKRSEILTNAVTTTVNSTVMSYTSSESGITKALNIAQTLTTNGGVGFNWSSDVYDPTRTSPPVKQYNQLPNVPYVTAFLDKDPAPIVLVKGLSFFVTPEHLFVLKLEADVDFSFPAAYPGTSMSGTIEDFPKFAQQRVYDL